MKHILLATSVAITFSSNVFAQEAATTRSPFENEMRRLEAGMVETREAVVEIGGVSYRKVQYEGKDYYLRTIQRTSELTEVYCSLPGKPSEGMLEAGLAVTKRTRLFVSALSEGCTARGGQVRPSFNLDPRIGLSIADKPQDKIKNKRLLFNPLDPLSAGFSGEF